MQPSQYHLPWYSRKNSTTLSALVISGEIMEFLYKMIIVSFRSSDAYWFSLAKRSRDSIQRFET
jgi:hypothetical protein